MKNEYWRRRAEEYEREWQARCQSELEQGLARYFQESLREIEDDIAALYGRFAKDNQLSYREAGRLIRGAEFNEWRMSLQEYVSAAHTSSAILKELNTLAMRSRISRLEKLYSETLKELQRLGEHSESAVRDFLTAAYRERYYHGVFDFAQVGKLEIPVSKVEPAKLEKVLAQRWAGGNFSTRIWKNTERLSKVLKQTITQGLHRGLSVQRMAKSIDKAMGAGYKNAERLVRTELNFVQNHAAKESMEAAGLSEYEFIATLDNRTSQRCRSLDGTVYLLEEYDPGTNAPPMHPRCRSTISAVITEGTRTAKVRGKNIRVPADMTYADYKAVYIDKTVTLKDWTAARENAKINLSIAGIAGIGAFDPRSLIAPTLPVKSRQFIEFQNYWKKAYSVKVSDDLAKLDFKAVKAAADGIEFVLKRFPASAHEITEFRVVTDNRIMSTSYTGQIAFNPIYFKDAEFFNEVVNAKADSGYHPKNTQIFHYGAHEAAHLIEIALIKKYGGDLDEWKSHVQACRCVIRAYGDVVRAAEAPKKLSNYKAEISGYAVDYGVEECFAEAVMDYVANGNSAAELSRAIWLFLEGEGI